MPVSKDELEAAQQGLETAVKTWLKVKAKDVDPDDGYDDAQTALIASDDPILTGWALIACYTSVHLEQNDMTAYAYDCADGQPAAFSRGLAMTGVDRWAN